MSPLKIFRPWDLREDNNTVADKLENNNDIDVTDLTDQKINDSISFRKHASNDSNIIRERIQEIRRSSEKLREKRTYLDDSKKSMCENNNEEQSSDTNKQINNNIDDLQECTNKISDSQSKKIENRFHPRRESSESNERHHRRHSRKHRSRSSLEINQDISLSSSPNNTTDTMASSILDLPGHIDPVYQTELFSNFEKQFYPDFRSLEFLPEDILDPILMSGLPLGAPLDPYWSNLALEYFKSHEASMKNKQQRPKKFNCPHCNVAFSNNGQLKGHIRIHTGEIEFTYVPTCCYYY